MNIITFDKKSTDFILETFDKSVDQEGYIIESSGEQRRVLSPDGEEVKKNNFAGIRKGSEIFIKSDLISLIELCDTL